MLSNCICPLGAWAQESNGGHGMVETVRLYLDETVESLVHGLAQAIQKRALPDPSGHQTS
jgi:hypothetical protein